LQQRLDINEVPDWSRRKRAKKLLRWAERHHMAEAMQVHALTKYGHHVWNLSESQLGELETTFLAMVTLMHKKEAERSIN
jgi:hypothetical protein